MDVQTQAREVIRGTTQLDTHKHCQTCCIHEASFTSSVEGCAHCACCSVTSSSQDPTADSANRWVSQRRDLLRPSATKSLVCLRSCNSTETVSLWGRHVSRLRGVLVRSAVAESRGHCLLHHVKTFDMKLIPSIDVVHSTAHGNNIVLAVPRAGAKMAGAAARAVRQTVARAGLRELSLYTDRTLHLGRRVVSITRQLSVKSVQVRHKQLTASILLQLRGKGGPCVARTVRRVHLHGVVGFAFS